MSEHRASERWQRGANEDFAKNRYSRAHVWRFDGGTEVRASSSPDVVRVPWSDPSAVDPEEAYVAALSSCHMLWFLSIAAKRRFRIDRYADRATGLMEKNADGKLAMTVVTLRPRVDFSGDKRPTPQQIAELHHAAHDECFIANSVRTEVRCEPVILPA